MNNHIWYDGEQYLSTKDAAMATLIIRYGPCTLKPRRDYFASLCESIISQQLAAKAAETIYNRFLAHYDGLPTPKLIANTSPEVLRGIGLSNQKGTYVTDLAKQFLTHTITPTSFDVMTDQEIITQLTMVKGIGKWTAQIFLIFALNRPDVLPVDDLGIKKAIANLYLLNSLPTPTEIENIAQPWQPFKTLASWYLWRSLENKREQ